MTFVTPQDFGAKADGATNDRAAILAAIQAAFGPTAGAPRSSGTLNQRLHFPAGFYYVAGGALDFPPVMSGQVTGEGNRASIIITDGSDGFSFGRGIAFSTIADLGFRSQTTTGTLVKITSDGSLASQGNLIRNLFCEDGQRSVHISEGVNGQGSENRIEGLQVRRASEAGLRLDGYNALSNTVIGGDLAGCQYGILVGSGSVNVYGTAFQGQTSFDIRLENHANESIVLDGIRTESANFIQALNKQHLRVTASQHCSTPGWFIWCRGNAMLQNCYSQTGQVGPEQGKVLLDKCFFGRDDWLGNVGVASRVATRHLTKAYGSAGETFYDAASWIGGVLSPA